MHNYQRNIEIFEENTKFFRQGFYKVNGTPYSFDTIRTMLANTKTFTERIDVTDRTDRETFRTKYGVLWTDSLSAAKMLIDNGEKVAVLNMANRYYAGGGYIKGSVAQEESLCRQSTLSESLFMQSRLNGYPMDIRHGAIYSPKVTVFRDCHYRLLDEPFNVGVISVDALNFNENMSHNDCIYIEGGDSQAYHLMNEEGRSIMSDKIHTILDIAVEYGYDSIVLGAFGCGAFMMDVREVASMFHDIIFNEAQYKGVFKSVVFAIMTDDTIKFKPFIDMFGSYQNE